MKLIKYCSVVLYLLFSPSKPVVSTAVDTSLTNARSLTNSTDPSVVNGYETQIIMLADFIVAWIHNYSLVLNLNVLKNFKILICLLKNWTLSHKLVSFTISY